MKRLKNQKDPSLPFKVIPQTAERLLSITCDRSGATNSVNFMKVSLDTIVEALGENRLSPQNKFFSTKNVFQINW